MVDLVENLKISNYEFLKFYADHNHQTDVYDNHP